MDITMNALGESTSAIAVAMVALAGVFIGSFWTSLTASRAVYISSITAERSKWIERLRTNIAAYSTTLAKASFKVGLFRSNVALKPDISPDQILSAMEELNQTISVIQLQLNPAGIVDRNILALINSVIIMKDTPIDLLDRADHAIIAHSQWLLKIEWEKVKYEARGWFNRMTHCLWEWLWIRKYNTWLLGDGDISQILVAFRVEKQKRQK